MIENLSKRVKFEKFTHIALDGNPIRCYRWKNLDKSFVPKAILQICHGSIEHACRYDKFARLLVLNGYTVYAHDHRGHGKTAGSIDKLSYFSDDNDGWEWLVNDTYQLTKRIKYEQPDLPVFILGHSLGSLLMRDYILRFGNEIQGVLLSATADGHRYLIPLGKYISMLCMAVKGRRANSPFLHNILYGAFSRKIKNRKTDYDWLNRNEVEVKKYIDDPYCGHTITPDYAFQLLKGVQLIYSSRAYRCSPNNLPMYIFSGDADPVGGKMGRDVRNCVQKYKQGGVQDVSLKLYSGARHEPLHEINQTEVFNDILQWLNQKINNLSCKYLSN